MNWHTLGIEPRSQNSHPTLIAIRPRTHTIDTSFWMDNHDGVPVLTSFHIFVNAPPKVNVRDMRNINLQIVIIRFGFSYFCGLNLVSPLR